MNYFNLIGLILNLGGALLLAFSIKVVKVSQLQPGTSIKFAGHEGTITTIKKKLFITGIILLILGFTLQLVGIWFV